MLSCELCCSFRAFRLLCLILLQESSLKNPFFSQMLCLGGLGLCFWMSVEVSCPPRRQSNHYLTAKAPPCCCEVRPVAAGSCSSAAVSAMGYALQRSLSVVAGCLSNGRLRQQWACISVGAGCLSNCRLHQQWVCVSVGAGVLGIGGHPSPTERLRDHLHG